MVGEHERRLDAAIVQPAATQRLVHVKIHATTVAVMEDEVPRTVAGPRVDPIDALGNERYAKTLEVVRIYPDVEIGMFPSLFAHQRVHGPTSTNARVGSVLPQGRQQGADCFRRHDVPGHALRISGGATAILRRPRPAGEACYARDLGVLKGASYRRV